MSIKAKPDHSSSDPNQPRELENPGDPGPPVLVPPAGSEDRRESEKLPPQTKPAAGV